MLTGYQPLEFTYCRTEAHAVVYVAVREFVGGPAPSELSNTDRHV
jgi:hypothetical protein